MKILPLMITAFLVFNSNAFAAAGTQRIPQFTNEKVAVWETIIYPESGQVLKMHRHEHDRVVVALDSGELKITNDKKQTHFLKLVKNKAYYLSKDVPGEMHSDENISKHPIRVMVIELNGV